MTTWVKERLKEYGQGKRLLEQYRATLIPEDPDDPVSVEIQAEIDTVSGMISDMAYSIEWMRTGRKPHTRRGIDIRDAYSRAILMDMDLLPKTPPEQEMRVTEKQKQELAKILLRLSARESQCYLLHMSQGMSYAEIAKEMGLSRSSVQYYVEMAKSKVQQEV